MKMRKDEEGRGSWPVSRLWRLRGQQTWLVRQGQQGGQHLKRSFIHGSGQANRMSVIKQLDDFEDVFLPWQSSTLSEILRPRLSSLTNFLWPPKPRQRPAV